MTSPDLAETVLVTVVVPAWGAYAASASEAVASAAHPQATTLVVSPAGAAPDLPGCRVLLVDGLTSVGSARNAALDYVTTPYVLFLDADDALLEGAIDEMLDIALGATGPIVVAARLQDGPTSREYHWPRPWQRAASRWRRVFAIAETLRPAFPVQGSLLPVVEARASGGYGVENEAAEDWILGVSLAWRCQVQFVSAPTMRYAPAPSGRWQQAQALRSHLRHRQLVRSRLRADPAARLMRALAWALPAAHLLGALRETWASRAHEGD